MTIKHPTEKNLSSTPSNNPSKNPANALHINRKSKKVLKKVVKKRAFFLVKKSAHCIANFLCRFSSVFGFCAPKRKKNAQNLSLTNKILGFFM